MKKCPYCAEEIQDKAVICRYCSRYVIGVRFHRIFRRVVTIIIIISLVFLVTKYRYQIIRGSYKINYKIKFFFYDLEENIKLIIEGLKAIKKYRSIPEGYNEVETIYKE